MRKTASALIGIVLALLALGIVMLASTSSVKGAAAYDDPYFFLKRQSAWLGVSLLLSALLMRFDYHRWRRFAAPVAAVSVLLLGMVFVSGLGVKVGGSYRWLRLGPFNIQPSEIAKFSVVVALAAWISHIGRRTQNFREGLLLPGIGLSVVLGLLLLEPDFGTTFLVGVVGMIILFAGGVRFSYLVIAAALGIGAFVVAVMQDPIRMARIFAFLFPEKYPATAYHLTQSKLAFIAGGPFGVGLGNSIQKQFYLPEAHTDFILAIIGEELGFLATFGVVALFLGLLICGMTIALHAPDTFGKLLGFGITMTLTLQMAINVGIVTGCLPTKGLPLPFISYGGSSLVVSVAAVGVLLNIALHGVGAREDDHTRSIRDLAHRLDE